MPPHVTRNARYKPAPSKPTGRLQVAGFALPRPNLAGGIPYIRPTSNALPALGIESVDGLLSGLDVDGRSYGYTASGSGRTVDVTIDLGAARQVAGSVRTRRRNTARTSARTG